MQTKYTYLLIGVALGAVVLPYAKRMLAERGI